MKSLKWCLATQNVLPSPENRLDETLLFRPKTTIIKARVTSIEVFGIKSVSGAA